MAKTYPIEKRTSWRCPKEVDARILGGPNIVKPLHNCLRGDAEVLTKTGWKRIDSVTTDDVIATWDKDTQEIIWDRPTETIKTFSKQMVRVSYKTYKTFGFLATPDHRLPIWRRDYVRPKKNGKRPTTGKPVYRVSENTVANLGLNVNNFFITAAKNGAKEKESQLTDLERLYISIQADGELRSEKNEIRRYRLSFKKDRKKERFEELCEKAKVKFTKIKHAENSVAKKNHYQAYDIWVNKECKNFWDCFDVTTFSQKKAQQFIEEISLWDGSCAETCGILNRRYCSTQLENIKFAQAVAMIAGLTSSFQKRDRDFPNRKTEYVLDFLEKHVRGTYDCEKKIEDFYDYAYCLSVPTTFFVARDADTGATMITGNCNPRTYMGQTAWDRMRKRTYYLANYKCEVCGADCSKPGQCEAHELYHVEYQAGVSTFAKVVNLCPRCHSFYHSGRLITLFKQGVPYYQKKQVLSIVEHGFKLIYDWNEAHPDASKLKAYATFLKYLKEPRLVKEMEALIDKYEIEFWEEDKKKYAKWEDWRLVFGTRSYPTKYKSYEDWEKAMEVASQNDSDRKAINNPFTGGVFDEVKELLDNS